MPSRSTYYKRKMKEENPEAYARYLETQKLANRIRRAEEKRRWQDESHTPAQIKEHEAKLKLKRDRERARYQLKKTKKMKETTKIKMGRKLVTLFIYNPKPPLKKRPKDMDEDELRAYNAMMRKKQRDARSSQKKTADNMKQRKRWREKKEEVMKKKLALQEKRRAYKKIYNLKHKVCPNCHTEFTVMPPKGKKKTVSEAESASPEPKGDENGRKETERAKTAGKAESKAVTAGKGRQKAEAVAKPAKNVTKPSNPKTEDAFKEEAKAPAKKGGWGWAHGRKRKADGEDDGGKSKQPSKPETDEAPKEEAKAPAKRGGWGWAHGRKKKADGEGDGEESKQPSKPETKEAPEEEAKAPAKKGGWGWAHGRKRKADGEGDDEEPKPKLKAKSSITDNFSETTFASKIKSASGKESNFKIASWNVNGLRAWLEKDGTAYIKAEKPDVLCVQELKCDKSKIPAEAQVEGYTTYWLSGDTEGYSGVGIYYKTKPLKITEGIGIKKHDEEGRVITAEFEKFYLVNTYIPNSGRGLPRLKYRTQDWDVEFRKYLKSLDAKKPVVWCGDLNVAHEEIDIRNPKGNKKTAGFTDEERNSFSETLKEGFIDSFRYLYPEEENAYTFWTYMMNARAKNAGWRLDYFVLSERLKEKLCDNVIRSKVMGSDHCPIVLYLAL